MDKKIILYCDGACRNNQSKINLGAWGAILHYGNNLKEIAGIEKDTTNNRMELMACIMGLQAIKNKNIKTEVITDSQYLSSGVNSWLYGWYENGWKNSRGQEVKNKDLWIKIMEEIENFPAGISFTHCNGHSDNDGNNRVDALINKAMDEYLKGEKNVE